MMKAGMKKRAMPIRAETRKPIQIQAGPRRVLAELSPIWVRGGDVMNYSLERWSKFESDEFTEAVAARQ
jgi:hypothetical protein